MCCFLLVRIVCALNTNDRLAVIGYDVGVSQVPKYFMLSFLFCSWLWEVAEWVMYTTNLYDNRIVEDAHQTLAQVRDRYRQCVCVTSKRERILSSIVYWTHWSAVSNDLELGRIYCQHVTKFGAFHEWLYTPICMLSKWGGGDKNEWCQMQLRASLRRCHAVKLRKMR